LEPPLAGFGFGGGVAIEGLGVIAVLGVLGAGAAGPGASCADGVPTSTASAAPGST
jgi:hypothetical protein